MNLPIYYGIFLKGVSKMANRDGKGAKPNKKKRFAHAKRKCPVCGSSLDKCSEHKRPGHESHRICKRCGYENF